MPTLIVTLALLPEATGTPVLNSAGATRARLGYCGKCLAQSGGLGQLLALSQVILSYNSFFTVLLPVLLPVLFTSNWAKIGVFINGCKVETIV